MKKVLTVVSIILCCFLLFACTEKPVEEAPALTINAYVTLYNAGTSVMQQKKIVATDIDKDNKINIDEVLFAAHKNLNKEGDYASATTQYGLSITKLLGDTSGSYGYYVNDASAWSLADEVKEGDYVTAYVYADKVGYSDSYSFFTIRNATAVKGEIFNLTLKNAGFDAEWNTVIAATEGATITVNGEAKEIVTDANGVATLSFAEAGTYVISATSNTVTLVPPVCVVTVK